jgi:hypothetical protein
MSADALDYEGLKAMAKERGVPVSTLQAQSHDTDPFYAGSPARRARAEWFADLWRRMNAGPGMHIRRFHYLLVSQRNPPPKLAGHAL